MFKKIYFETVKAKLIALGIVGGGVLGVYLFFYLSMIGAITDETYSGDKVCNGTIDFPCYAHINFTAKEDIFVYPIDYDPWDRNANFEFDPNVKSWKMQRSWGTGWRNIPLNQSCTGTWCGLSNSKDTRKFSIAFREGRTYQIRIEVIKHNPFESIKWTAFDVIDPVFYGSNYVEVDGKVKYEKKCIPVYEDIKQKEVSTCYRTEKELQLINVTSYSLDSFNEFNETCKNIVGEYCNNSFTYEDRISVDVVVPYECYNYSIIKRMSDCIYTGELIEIGEINKSYKIENYACGYDNGIVCDEKYDIDGGTGDGNGDGRCQRGETCIRQ